MSLLLIIAGSVVTISNTELTKVRQEFDSVQAFYAADSVAGCIEVIYTDYSGLAPRNGLLPAHRTEFKCGFEGSVDHLEYNEAYDGPVENVLGDCPDTVGTDTPFFYNKVENMNGFGGNVCADIQTEVIGTTTYTSIPGFQATKCSYVSEITARTNCNSANSAVYRIFYKQGAED